MGKSSKQWCREHSQNLYVRQAIQSGYRSRAVYKLAQIDARDHLLRSGMTVVDLGAAPGGWSQWIKQQWGAQIRLFALDLLEMSPLPEVTFIQGDFRETTVLAELFQHLGEQKVDLVISDMSPNITGIKAVDQARVMLLAELALDFACKVLNPKGNFLTKVFQGEGIDEYLKNLKNNFKQVIIRKPDASRAQSAELYIVAKHYIGE